MTEYYELKLYLKEKQRREDFKQLIVHFGTGDKAIERILLAYKSGLLDTKCI